MTARSEITIDMGEFGAEGTITMTFPSLRRQAMMKNALGNCAKIEVVNGENVVKETNLGDVEIVEVLGGSLALTARPEGGLRVEATFPAV